jgi:hypothetical protein
MKSAGGAAAAPISLAKAGPKPERDEDDGHQPLVPPTPKFNMLPTGLSRAIVISALLAVSAAFMVAFVSGRYALTAPAATDTATVFRIDRLRGEVSVCTTLGCKVLEERAR